MVKVVYNAKYGGFGLSREAVIRAREISGDPEWGGPCIAGDIDDNGSIVDGDYGCLDFAGVKRHDPVLVQVVEELGKKANSKYCYLSIREIPSGSKYRIDEYDGLESVVMPDEYTWEDV